MWRVRLDRREPADNCPMGPHYWNRYVERCSEPAPQYLLEGGEWLDSYFDHTCIRWCLSMETSQCICYKLSMHSAMNHTTGLALILAYPWRGEAQGELDWCVDYKSCSILCSAWVHIIAIQRQTTRCEYWACLSTHIHIPARLARVLPLYCCTRLIFT